MSEARRLGGRSRGKRKARVDLRDYLTAAAAFGDDDGAEDHPRRRGWYQGH